MADDSRRREQALEVIERRLVEAAKRLAELWDENPKLPMPPGYLTALKEAHKAIATGLSLAAKGAGAGETKDPSALLMELEAAVAQVRRQVQMGRELGELPDPRKPDGGLQ